MTVGWSLRNTGNSPALHAHADFRLIALSMTGNVLDEVKQRQAEFFDPMRQTTRPFLTNCVFPGDHIPIGQQGMGIDKEKVANAMKSRDAGRFAKPGQIALALIACVDYQTSFSQVHHQTRYGWCVGIPNGNGSWQGDLTPVGTPEGIRLIHLLQSAE